MVCVCYCNGVCVLLQWCVTARVCMCYLNDVCLLLQWYVCVTAMVCVLPQCYVCVSATVSPGWGEVVLDVM